jgi:hypothetical protein
MQYSLQLICQYAELDTAVWAQGLCRACEYRHRDIVALLLATPAVDPAFDEYACLRSACTGGSLHVFKVVLPAREWGIPLFRFSL